jgi:hypothetical protein
MLSKVLYINLSFGTVGFILMLLVMGISIFLGDFFATKIFDVKINDQKDFMISSYYRLYPFARNSYSFNLSNIHSYKTANYPRGGETFILYLRNTLKIRITKMVQIFGKDDYALFKIKIIELIEEYNKNGKDVILDKETSFYKSLKGKIFVYSQIILAILLIITAIILYLFHQSQEVIYILLVFGAIIGFLGSFNFIKQFILNSQ